VACSWSLFFSYHHDARSNKHQIHEYLMFCTVGCDTMYSGREVQSLLLRTVVTYMPNRE